MTPGANRYHRLSSGALSQPADGFTRPGPHHASQNCIDSSWWELDGRSLTTSRADSTCHRLTARYVRLVGRRSKHFPTKSEREHARSGHDKPP